MEERNNNFKGPSAMGTVFTIICIVLLILVGYKMYEIGKEMHMRSDPEAKEERSYESIGAKAKLSAEVEASTEAETSEDVAVVKDPEPKKSEPKISDYFVKTAIVENNESQYRFSDGSERIDTLINDYNYFDMYHFAAEYIGDTKLGFIRLAGDDSLHLTAEQSPVDSPTTIVRNDIQLALRIIKDPEGKVETYQDDYDDYIDIRTIMDNDSNLGTIIYVCHKDTCYRGKYIGKAIPSDIVFNVDYANNGINSDQTSSFFFMMEKDALKSFLKMAEAGVLFTDKNPFEAIGDEWEEVENYSLFSGNLDTEG